MNFFWDTIIGFIISLIGVALPGLINMTVVKVTLERGMKAGLWFCLGACITIFLQAWIAVAFAGYLSRHTEIVSFLKGASVFIFFLLCLIFFYLALHQDPSKPKRKPKNERPILLGMAIAAMNFLNVPFYFSMSTLLEDAGRIQVFFPVYFFFIAGLTLGSGAALLIYLYGAQWIVKKAKFLSRYLNAFLSGLFLLLGILQLIQIYFQ